MRLSILVALALAGCEAAAPLVTSNCAPAPLANRFRMAVFGDVRPPRAGATADYPEAIIRSLFQQIAARAPNLVVGTGDYLYAEPDDLAAATAQIERLRVGERAYAGPIYHALGNHECAIATDSNCPRGDETALVRAFMRQLLPPRVTKPYYRVDLETGLGRAKLILVAANAWSEAQASWLEAQLSDSTPYTFVVRHEPPSSRSALGVSQSEAIIHRHPLTLELLGHIHRYQRLDAKHVISGNGGAPLTSGGYFGFLLIDLLTNGNLAVQEIDEATGRPTDQFTICPQ